VLIADVYGGVYRMTSQVYEPKGYRFTYVPAEEFDENLASHLGDDTRIVWVETPSNPLLNVVDIRRAADAAHAAGALLAVDNTFASPYLQQPIALGADLVVHSTTKYLGGHSDVVGGAVIGAAELLKPIAFYQNAAGGVPGPFDAYLTLRGLKTLAVRMDRHCANARRLATWLTEQQQIERVYYPGLPSHPGHQLAMRQMRDFGGMISMRMKGGGEAARRFLPRTKLFSLAESLGGVESLVCHPATMTHASIPAELRQARGVDDGLIRLSVGIEDADDLQEDLRQALAF
jgi:cystathionine gamma-lyase